MTPQDAQMEAESVPLADDPRTPNDTEPAGPPAEDLATAPADGLIAEAAPAGDLGPIKPVERIAEMDILRGFALLGICVINLQSFLAPNGLSRTEVPFPAAYDRVAEFLINLFGSGKFNAMFSFLFGVGFAIQMERAAAKKAGFAGMYLRRVFAMFLFGAAHLVLLWEGDILHVYAAIAVPLILFRKLRDRWLWLAMVLTLIAPIGWFTYTAIRDGEPTPEKRLEKAHEIYNHARETLDTYGKGEYIIPEFVPPPIKKKEDKKDGSAPADTTKADTSEAKETPPPAPRVKVTAHPSYAGGVSLRVRDWLRGMREGMAWFWAIMATTMIIGFIAGRRGIFQDIPGHRKFIIWVTAISGVIGLGIAIVFATASLLAIGGMEDDTVLGIVAGLAYIFGRPFLCAFYMGVLVLLAQTDRFRRLLAPLALVGRMPLTNYLTHSVVFAFLFYGWGIGLFYRVGPALSLPIAFTLYGLQVAFSNWWMKRFRFGPMEWLWRTMTYGKAPAIQ